jgi:HAAS
MPLGLPDEARIELNRYLRRMRAALRGYPSVDVDEIERDVRSHIDAALEESPSPVTARHVRDVLDRLGSPSQWVPPDDLPLWRKAVLHFFGGTDDWRLTYLTGALCVAGFC